MSKPWKKTALNTTILLRRSKTDQEASGRWLHLSERSHTALKAWLGVLQDSQDPIFRSINKHIDNAKALGPSQINRIYKQIARNARVDKT